MKITELVGTPADQQGKVPSAGPGVPGMNKFVQATSSAPKPGEQMGAMDANSPEAQKAKQEQKKQIQDQIKSTQMQLKQLQQQLASIK